MKASVEISLYPLNQNFIPAIDDFIAGVKSNKKLSVKVNTMSTQIFGDYDEIWDTLKMEIRKSFEKEKKAVFVLKVLNSDLNA